MSMSVCVHCTKLELQFLTLSHSLSFFLSFSTNYPVLLYPLSLFDSALLSHIFDLSSRNIVDDAIFVAAWKTEMKKTKSHTHTHTHTHAWFVVFQRENDGTKFSCTCTRDCSLGKYIHRYVMIDLREDRRTRRRSSLVSWGLRWGMPKRCVTSDQMQEDRLTRASLLSFCSLAHNSIIFEDMDRRMTSFLISQDCLFISFDRWLALVISVILDYSYRGSTWYNSHRSSIKSFIVTRSVLISKRRMITSPSQRK